MSQLSTTERTLNLFRSLRQEDKAYVTSEILIDYRYDDMGQRILAHHLDSEAIECIDNVRRLQRDGETANNEDSAKRIMSLGEIITKTARRTA